MLERQLTAYKIIAAMSIALTGLAVAVLIVTATGEPRPVLLAGWALLGVSGVSGIALVGHLAILLHGGGPLDLTGTQARLLSGFQEFPFMAGVALVIIGVR